MATLFDLIREEQWERAWQVVRRDPRAGYSAKIDRNNSGDIVRVSFPLHELCRMVNFIDHVDDNEFSDDEDEEMFTDEQRERNHEIYKLARFMIRKSHTIEEPVRYYEREGTDGAVRYTRHRSILSLAEAGGNTPLHVLCSQCADPAMIRLLLECAPLEEMTDVYYLTSQARPEDLIRIENDNRCTPVHFVVENSSCPFSALKLMVEFCATSPQRLIDARHNVDKDGDVPLHWAFAAGISPRRIRTLVSGCHETLLAVNKASKLPFQEYVDEYCENFDLMDDDEKLAMWSYIQEVLKIVTGSDDDDTWSPLQAIASDINFVPEAIWSIALTFESDRRNTYNQDGLLPLHAAVSSPPQNAARVLHAAFSSPPRLSKRREEYLSMMREIMYSYPEAASMPTSRGRLALHLAIESSQISSVISTLLLESPHALLTIDPVTELPPFMLAAVDDINGLTTVYELLRKDPSILLSRRRRSVVAM